MILISDGTLKFDTKLDDSDFVEGIQKMSSKQIGLQNSIKKTEQEMAKLEKAMHDMKNVQMPTQEYQAIQNQIDGAQKKLNGYLETEKRMVDTGAKQSGSAWKNLQWNIEETTQTITYAKAELEELKTSGQAFTIGGDTSKLSDMQDRYTLLNGKLSEYKAKLSEVVSAGIQQVVSSSRVLQALSMIATIAVKAAASLSKLVGVTISIASGFARMAIGIGKGAGKVISSIKNITSMFSRGRKGARGYGQSLKGILKSMVLYQGLRRIIRGLATTMWSNMKTNDQFVASFAQVKGNLYTAFQPIYTAVMPAINALMQILVKASGYLAQFTSLLTGTTVKASQEAAKAQYKQAKALKETGKAAKDTNKQLSGLDELNNITDNDSSSGDSSKIAPDFDTNIETSDSVSNFAEKLKKAWASSDFTEIGSIVADKINTSLEGMNWDKIEATTQNIAKSIYTFINGFVKELDWSLVGNTLGNGINTAIGTMSTFVKGVDWGELGTGIGTGVNSAIKTINWENIGKLVSDGMNSISTFINSFYKSVDWTGFGGNIASSLNTSIKNTNWTNLGTAIGNGLNMAIKTAYGFITTFDWGGFGKGIADGINGILTTTDWISLAKGASSLAIGLLNTVSTAIREIDWRLVGNSIGDMISNIDWLGIAGGLIDLLVSAFNGLLSLIWGIGESIGKNIAEGLANGISLSDIIKNAATWVNDHIFKPIVGNIKKLFGIHSPSTVMKDIGTYIMQGLINGITSLVSSVKEKFKTLVTNIKEYFTNIPTWFESKFNSALNKIKSAFSSTAIKTHFAQIWTDIKSCFSNVSSWFKDTFSKAWTNVKNVFSTGGKIFDGIKDGVADTFKSVVNKLIDGINAIISVPFTKINSMVNTLQKIPIVGPYLNGFSLSIPKIPKLATGTVVPSNYGEFLAILGDNKREAEVVSPLSTIKQAVREELGEGGGNGGEFTLHLTIIRDGKKEHEEMIKINQEQADAGNIAFALG